MLNGRMDGNMKKALKIALGIFLIVLTVFYFRFGGKNSQAEASVAFKELETDDIYEELYVFATVSKDDEEKIETVWNDIITNFNMKSNNPIVSFDKDGVKQEERQTDNGKVFVDMTNTVHKDNYSIYVNINTSDNSLELQNSITDLEKILNAQNLKYEVTLSIKGTKLGKLNKDEIFNIKELLMTKCNANLVSEFDEDGIYSCTAFSKDMGRFVRIGGKKVNLNIAVRYSDTDDKTYIYLATPVIRTEV